MTSTLPAEVDSQTRWYVFKHKHTLKQMCVDLLENVNRGGNILTCSSQHRGSAAPFSAQGMFIWHTSRNNTYQLYTPQLHIVKSQVSKAKKRVCLYVNTWHQKHILRNGICVSLADLEGGEGNSCVAFLSVSRQFQKIGSGRVLQLYSLLLCSHCPNLF